jgi:dipeptidyl aminopeptidase/acylaminoacyl peptidase
MSPDGKSIAYLLSVPRKPFKDDDGPAWAELHVIGEDGVSRPYVTGEVNVGAVKWTPDGSAITFLTKRTKDKHKSLYLIPHGGGEARKIVNHETDIEEYDWSPDGKYVSFLAPEKEPKDKKKLADKGFAQEIFEEELRPARVWTVIPDQDDAKPKMLEVPGSASELHWSPTGTHFALAIAPTPLVDDRYMKRRVQVIEAESGRVVSNVDNPGKLGALRWSPDGKHLAYISAQDLHDPQEGRLMTVPALSNDFKDALPNYEGHVSGIEWQDNDTVMFLGDEGVWSTFGEVRSDGSQRKVHIAAGKIVLTGFSLSKDGQSVAMIVNSDRHPGEVFVMRHGDAAPKRLTESRRP